VEAPEPAVEEEEPAPEAETPAAAPTAYAAKAQGATSVNMGDNFFSPATITIGVGDTVTWSNSGQVDHTATGSGFDTGTVAPSASASHTFATAGTFSYVCALHSDMTGTVQVRGDSGTDPGSDPGGDGTTGTEASTETSTDPATAAPGSEAAAALDPNQPGQLPATGEPEGALILFGVGLIGCGLLAAATARLREREVLDLTDRPSSLPLG
jgi:plastocyanin